MAAGRECDGLPWVHGAAQVPGRFGRVVLCGDIAREASRRDGRRSAVAREHDLDNLPGLGRDAQVYPRTQETEERDNRQYGVLRVVKGSTSVLLFNV